MRRGSSLADGTELVEQVPLVGLFRVLGPIRFLRQAVVDGLLTPAVVAEYPPAAEQVIDGLRRADRKGLYLTMRSTTLGRPDLSDHLRRITSPTVLAAGDDDPLRTLERAGVAAATLPHGRAVMVTGSRHVPALEAPEQVLDLITNLWPAAANLACDADLSR